MTPPADLSEVPTRDLIFNTRWSVLLYAYAGGMKTDSPIVLAIRQKVADEVATRLAGKSREPIR